MSRPALRPHWTGMHLPRGRRRYPAVERAYLVAVAVVLALITLGVLDL